MTRRRWWYVAVGTSITIVALDVATHADIRFAILFTLPVTIAAWHVSRGAGIALAMALVGCRAGIATMIDQAVTPVAVAAVNAGIQLAVLMGLTAAIAGERERQSLKHRVQVLEGILPICMFCKKIRRPDGLWEPVEAYVRQRSSADFSHGICEKCGQDRYGDLSIDSDSGRVRDRR